MAAIVDVSGISGMLTRARAHFSSTSSTTSVVRVSGGQDANHSAGATVPTHINHLSSASPTSRPLSQISDGFALAQLTQKSLTDLSFHLESFRPLIGGSGPSWRLELDQHISEMQSMAAQARFHGEQLFDGQTHSFQFDVGVSAQHNLELDISVDMERSLIEHVTIGGEDISDGVYLGDEGLAIQVGNETVVLYGSYESGEAFVKAINEAGIDGLTASLTNDGSLKLHAYRPIEIVGPGASDEHVNISGTLATTPSWVPQSVPLLKTTVDVEVHAEHIDSLLAAINVQRGKLDTFQSQLETALRDVGRLSRLPSKADIQQLANQVVSSLSQQPESALGAQANAQPDDVLAVT